MVDACSVPSAGGLLLLFAFLTEPKATLWALLWDSWGVFWEYAADWVVETVPTPAQVDAAMGGTDDWVGEPADYLERMFRPVTDEEKAEEEKMKKALVWVMDDTLPDHRPVLPEEALPPLPLIVKG